MKLNTNYIAVEKIEEEKQEGFETVQVQDSFTYKGRVVHVPAVPTYIGDTPVSAGSVVLFAKYSPDTHEIDIDGQKLKFVSIRDVLAIL